MRRLPAHMLGPRADRPPVSSYQEAVWWLVNSYRMALEPLAANEPLPDAAVLVLDMFWITEGTLRADIRKALSEVVPASLPVRRLDRRRA